MKCQEVKDLLLSYLGGEITSSERTLIQAHLNTCDACRRELTTLATTQDRVRRFLQARAAQAVPSPQAWNRLEARLTKETLPPSLRLPAWLRRLTPGVGQINNMGGMMPMKKGLALGAIAILFIALSTMAFVPSAGAQVKELLRWFRFGNLTGGEVSIPGSAEFTPLEPTYLPAGMGVGLNSEGAALSYWNSATNQILLIDQIRASALLDKSLPSGAKVTVNGRPAVLITGLKGSVTFARLSPTPSAPVLTPTDSDQVVPLEPMAASTEAVSYTDGRELVWYIDDIRVRITSTLPGEEMIRVAESLTPAKAVK